jgi:hypothetical protein
MSVYTELLRVGVNEDAARQIADVAHEGTVTKQYLDLKLAQLESRLAWKVVGAMVGLTAIFAILVGLLR